MIETLAPSLCPEWHFAGMIYTVLLILSIYLKQGCRDFLANLKLPIMFISCLGYYKDEETELPHTDYFKGYGQLSTIQDTTGIYHQIINTESHLQGIFQKYFLS